MVKIRPEIDDTLIYAIKARYPKETARLSDGKTITWAIKKFLGVN